MIVAALILIIFAALAAPPAVSFVAWALWRALHDSFPGSQGSAGDHQPTPAEPSPPPPEQLVTQPPARQARIGQRITRP
jgi:hypothetical protein